MSTTVTIDTDGVRSPDYANELGDALYETVRALNHITQAKATLPHASDVYRLLGELKSAAAGLPQLYRQIGERLNELDADGRLVENPYYGSHGGSAPAATLDCLSALERAADDAAAMTEALENARSATSGLETRPS